MTWERVKLAFVLLFFVGILVFTGRSQKDVLQQKDPHVINFLTKVYCPEMIRPTGGEPLHQLTYLRRDWEKIAAQKHAQGVPGFDRDWRIRFLENPELAGLSTSWTLTRLMGGMAPEVLPSMNMLDFREKCHLWYVDLTPYLLKPNPYVPGNKRWMDIFYRDALAHWQATANGRLYAIPIDEVEVAIFYNKNLLRQCGIDVDKELPPEDWAAFIDLQRRIKAHGVIPFLMPAGDNMRVGWMYGILNDMIWSGRFSELHVRAPDEVGPIRLWGQDLVRAIRTGRVHTTDEQYLAAWRILKDWSQYWQKGFLGAGDNMAFRRGQAAMTLDGSWFIRTLDNDKERDWDYGLFFIPKLTQQTTRFATGALARGVGGASAVQYSVTRESVQRKGAVDATVDFLMYITAPQHAGPLIAEGQQFLPAIKYTEPYFQDTKLKFMLPVLKRGGVGFYGFEDLTTRSRDEWWAVMQCYLEGTYDEQKVSSEMAQVIERSIQESLEKYRDEWCWVTDAKGRPTWDIDYVAQKAKDKVQYILPMLPDEPEESPTTESGPVSAAHADAKTGR